MSCSNWAGLKLNLTCCCDRVEPWFSLLYRGDEILPSYMGIVINHEIRIPVKQMVFVVLKNCQAEDDHFGQGWNPFADVEVCGDFFSTDLNGWCADRKRFLKDPTIIQKPMKKSILSATWFSFWLTFKSCWKRAPLQQLLPFIYC